MSRALSFLLFFVIFTGLVTAAHLYSWNRLIRDPGWPLATQRSLKLLWWGLGLSIPGSLFVARSLSGSFGSRILYIPYVWLGILFLLTVVLLLSDAGRLLHQLGTQISLTAAIQSPTDPPADPGRRQALARLLAGVVTGATALLTSRSLYNGFGRVAVKRIEVELARLPKKLDGMTIVQLTDMHVGPVIGRDFVEEIVARANELAPHLVVITGDLVDGSVPKLLPLLEPLRELVSTHGVYFVTGNHEYYSGVTAWCQALPELKVQVLRNESVYIGAHDDGFHLAGVDDISSAGSPDGHDLERALAGCTPGKAVVLLAHQPRSVLEASKRGVDLQLSGHTHGGQMFPFNWLVKLAQPIVSGLGKFGDTLVYVSNGTGYWGPPMRLGAPAEITQIVLRSTSTA